MSSDQTSNAFFSASQIRLQLLHLTVQSSSSLFKVGPIPPPFVTKRLDFSVQSL